MSIALLLNHANSEVWKEVLQKKLPEAKIEVFPDVSDLNSIEFVLAWKAEKGTLSSFPNLKAIQSNGASVSHIFSIYDVPDHIQVSRIVDHRLSDDMFEHVLAVIMKELKNLEKYAQDKANKIWKKRQYRGIENTVITILGAGVIGQHVASRLSNLGFNLNVWSRSPKTIPKVNSITRDVDLHNVLSKTDFLVDILPLTAFTTGIIDLTMLSHLKRGAYFINVGRGEQLKEDDLLSALDKKLISGASLDVFHEEPLPEDHPFWEHPDIEITPHVASMTNIDSATDLIAKNYLRMKNNEKLLHCVEKQKGY